MCINVNELAEEVKIALGFPGIYKWTQGSSSYYFNGDKNSQNIHFTVYGDNVLFTKFHISFPIGLFNAHIYYERNINNFNELSQHVTVNVLNLPTNEMVIWNEWYGANAQLCLASARDFWAKMNVCNQ